MTTKHTYDIKTPDGEIVGRVKAKDLHCAAIQARRKFWPKGASVFSFSVFVLSHQPKAERVVLTLRR